MSRCFFRLLSYSVALVVLAGAVSASELPEGFRLEPVVTGLNNPSAVAVAPDGRILIAERTTGDLRQIWRGELVPIPLCHVDVETTNEAGLLGVAVHPEFRSNGWIYLYYTESASGSNVVKRFTIQNGCGSPTTIASGLGAGPGFRRNGGGIAFGPDGMLYIATGDMEGPGDAQNPTVMAGKILRLEDDGAIPADNPTPGSAVYAMGLRDGRGLAVAASGDVYASDDGDVSDVSHDELNHVPAGGDLGWDAWTGGGSATYDDPLVDWSASPDNLIGMAGLAVYGAQAFPNQAGDGLDNDEDKYGEDGLPGDARVDDDSNGVCVGGKREGEVCTANAMCPGDDIDTDGSVDETAVCLFIDDPAEYCPGGVPYDDDACGADGTDEPDESHLGNVFLLAADSDEIVRATMDTGSPDTLSESATFFDPTVWADCPTNWTGIATGNNGWLYAVAVNGGGATDGGLYRIVHDAAPGPREVSPPFSHFPLQVDRGAGDTVIITWEDLRRDAMQPRDNGSSPQAPEREYTVWSGDLGSFYSHNPVVGLENTPGGAVNDALRSVNFNESGDRYFLVSGRGDNLEGSLGHDSNGVERPGYAVTDFCDTLGDYLPGGPLWRCGQDFTLLDENGRSRSLHDFRGHPIMLDLSAVWCGPCNTEAEEIEIEVNQFYKDRGVVTLTVIMDDGVSGGPYPGGRPAPGDCMNWGNRVGTVNDHTFPCLADTRPYDNGPLDAWPKYGTGFLPTNAVLDSGMRVVYVGSGWTGATETAVKAALDAMVANESTCLK